MGRSAYCKSECLICGQRISTAGFAQHSHKMKHVREGLMEEYWTYDYRDLPIKRIRRVKRED